MQGRYHWTDRQVDSIEWELVSSSIFTQTYATRRTMTKYNHQRLMSNNKAIDNQMICPYCHQTKESFDHDQFLTCIESGERKDVRIQSFKQLLAQLKTPTTITNTLIDGLHLAHQERHHPASPQPSPTQHHAIGWNHFIRERLSKDLTITMIKYYKTAALFKIPFTGIGRMKAIIKFKLKTHVNEWNHRYDLNFTQKRILHNHKFMTIFYLKWTLYRSKTKNICRKLK